jgi:hypothetical protein
MRAYPLRGEAEGGWALEFESFLGPVNWHRADRRVQFGALRADSMSKLMRFNKPSVSYLLFEELSI